MSYRKKSISNELQLYFWSQTVTYIKSCHRICAIKKVAERTGSEKFYTIRNGSFCFHGPLPWRKTFNIGQNAVFPSEETESCCDEMAPSELLLEPLWQTAWAKHPKTRPMLAACQGCPGTCNSLVHKEGAAWWGQTGWGSPRYPWMYLNHSIVFHETVKNNRSLN